MLLALVALVMVLGVATSVWPNGMPVSILTIPAIIGGWLLSRPSLALVSGLIMVFVVVDLWTSPDARSAWAAAIVVLVTGLGFRYATLRERWGLSATQGMPILLETRERVRGLGEPPPLGDGWVMARALRSAGDQAFRGDFTLTRRAGPQVQAMVVDVSGHGLSVAGRATQLAGAFGGLIQVVPAHTTLAACNNYVASQGWDHEYATAVHVVLDETTGVARVACAGHPAPEVRRADGGWERVVVRGPVLGLAPDSSFDVVDVAIGPGDCLVMVSDGALAEHSDDPWGAAHGAVEQWLRAGAVSGTHPLPPLSSVADDDQTILVLHRRGVGGPH